MVDFEIRDVINRGEIPEVSIKFSLRPFYVGDPNTNEPGIPVLKLHVLVSNQCELLVNHCKVVLILNVTTQAEHIGMKRSSIPIYGG